MVGFFVFDEMFVRVGCDWCVFLYDYVWISGRVLCRC